MVRLILRWILLALSVVVASFITRLLTLKFNVELHSTYDFIKLLIGVAVLAFLNATLGRILKFLTLPLNCLTLGLFSLVINTVILIIVANMNLGFTIGESGAEKFITAFVASLLISAVNSLLGAFVPDKDEDE